MYTLVAEGIHFDIHHTIEGKIYNQFGLVLI